MDRLILAFKNKPHALVEAMPEDILTYHAKPAESRCNIPQHSEMTLGAPGHILSIALRNSVYLWDASDESTWEFVNIDEV
ncbi:hypothetical protein ACS0TY_000398 [Phlomoides rotata]